MEWGRGMGMVKWVWVAIFWKLSMENMKSFFFTLMFLKRRKLCMAFKDFYIKRYLSFNSIAPHLVFLQWPHVVYSCLSVYFCVCVSVHMSVYCHHHHLSCFHSVWHDAHFQQTDVTICFMQLELPSWNCEHWLSSRYVNHLTFSECQT